MKNKRVKRYKVIGGNKAPLGTIVWREGGCVYIEDAAYYTSDGFNLQILGDSEVEEITDSLSDVFGLDP